MKYEDIVVDGEVQCEGKHSLTIPKGRQLVAGLRLLRHYGRIADQALKILAKGDDFSMVLPYVEPPNRSYKGYYSVTKVPVHREMDIPKLPDYSKLSLRLEKLKPPKRTAFSAPLKKSEEAMIAAGYQFFVPGPVLGVFGNGRIREIAVDEPVGSAWYTKTRVSFNFRSVSTSKSGKSDVNKAMAEAVSKVLVQLKSEGRGEVWHSRAVRMHDVLRRRCEAILLLDGHADRLRSEVVAHLTVNEVHSF